MDYKDYLIKNFRGSHFTINELAERAYFDKDFPSGFNQTRTREYVEEHYPHLINEFGSSWRSFINVIDSGRKSGKNRKSVSFTDGELERIRQFKDDNRFKSELAAIHALVLLGLKNLD